MHNKKYNNKTSNFIQGLRPFSSSIPRGLKKILKKGGYNFSNIVDNWTKMVGKQISEACYPSKIKTSKDNINGTLILNVIHGKELDVEYSKKDIIDKINTFFGYNCVEQIKLRVIRKEEKREISNITNGNNKKFEKQIETIKNNDLKNSLDQLIKAFNSKKND
jgi:hypothetical protein|tara:strand:- start:501 stop:989 length:489 start_codon:yes stop_codon:yes gene_type:complete